MSNFPSLQLAFAASVFFSAGEHVVAQALGVNPSAAASDVGNPSSTNPSAAASDVRNPSATNPSAAASQMAQPTAGSPRATNVAPSVARQRTAAPPRRAPAVQRARQHQPISRRANAATEMVRPFEALEGARLDRVEFEKRAAQDKVQQRLLEKEQKTKQIADKKAEAAKRAGERGPHHGAVGHHEYTQSCYTEFW
jgi:hypothetical protein